MSFFINYKPYKYFLAKAAYGLKITTFTYVLLVLLTFSPVHVFAQFKNEEIVQCATMNGYDKQLEKDPKYRENRRKIETFTQDYVKQLKAKGDITAWSGEVIIPVVVHVLYNPSVPEQNISDAQIARQIAILNEDYRRMNADAASAPAVFRAVSADTRIEFRLAQRDPNCFATSGIERRSTTNTNFTYDDDQRNNLTGNPIKSFAAGGLNAWPRDKYLNIWVGNIRLAGFGGSTLLGYATFPGDPAIVDGVVMNYRAFGDIGSHLLPNYNRGRTLTHEVGHWLNLYHIWGNDFPVNCTDSDEVDDTPNQLGPSSMCSTFPKISCSNDPNGDMFMNFMDYGYHACKTMFTQGQSSRMAAALISTRAAILSSDAYLPPPATASADLWSQDTPDDLGNEPNLQSSDFYTSNDIWVRNTNDGFTFQDHQNPIYRPGMSCYVYVRVRNRGCTVSGSADVKLYWAKASTALAWPSPWNGSITSPALMGALIGTKPTGMVAGGGYSVLEFAWTPPNPDNYTTAFPGAEKSHFCLLSRIETTSGMTIPEGPNLGVNVQNNNNIVWKNISVSPADGGFVTVTVGNFKKKYALGKFTFTLPDHSKNQRSEFSSFLRYGTITVDLGEKLYKKWIEGFAIGDGFDVGKDGLLYIRKPNAYIENIVFEPKDIQNIKVSFSLNEQVPFGNSRYNFDIKQYEFDGQTDQFLGGERFVINADNLSKKLNWDNNNLNSITDTKVEKQRGVEVSAVPNPTSSSARIKYYLPKASIVELIVYDAMGNTVVTLENTQKDSGYYEVLFQAEHLPKGIYFYRLKALDVNIVKRILITD